jgi:hypothetical protein
MTERHGLAVRAWAVDDLWFLAEEDFAPAAGVELPPRKLFLGALQKVHGVRVQYDRRVRDRSGRVRCKTTFYALPGGCEAAAAKLAVAA